MKMYSSSFLGVLQSLPLTAYIKMVDLWLLCMMLYPFFLVILLSAEKFLRKSEDKIEPKSNGWTNNRRLKIRLITILLNWGLPLVLCIFIIVYSTIGFWNFTNPNLNTVCDDNSAKYAKALTRGKHSTDVGHPSVKH